MKTEPDYPADWVHPKCPGCGHNYFNRPAVPPDPTGLHGKYPDGGICEWCREEELDYE